VETVGLVGCVRGQSKSMRGKGLCEESSKYLTHLYPPPQKMSIFFIPDETAATTKDSDDNSQNGERITHPTVSIEIKVIDDLEIF
jgi:hypothetical protein